MARRTIKVGGVRCKWQLHADHGARQTSVIILHYTPSLAGYYTGDEDNGFAVYKEF